MTSRCDHCTSLLREGQDLLTDLLTGRFGFANLEADLQDSVVDGGLEFPRRHRGKTHLARIEALQNGLVLESDIENTPVASAVASAKSFRPLAVYECHGLIRWNRCVSYPALR